ncbi:MAG TPA: ABC transporter substrate-binding protein [Baekduia sp.]|uniref:ABC transporter substrate-binding protein n=1 Tax=Baekduia sp. TaxID=2600305 RepID=UPI002D76D010|nr:ABC transporter substrate-binding protein [Baekduia sp.]HET6509869.1 ABC transporter substrate-binding protein [Baekduia sp.]
MKITPLSAVLPAALVVSALAAGCGGGSGSGAGGASATASADTTTATAITRGGTLRFGDTVVDCADPHQRGNNPSSYQLKPVTDSLLAQDPKTGRFLPWLATAYTVNDSATKFTFTLRQGVTFSDGTPLDGQAVADSIDAIVNKLGAAASLPIGYLNNYKDAKATGANTVEVDFSKPNIAFLQGTATTNLGIVSEATSKLSAEQRCAKGVVGTGPFVITKFTPAQSLAYKRRADYQWANPLGKNRGPAYLDGLQIVSIKDTSVLANSLLSNQIDAYSVVLPQDAGRIDQSGGHVYTTTNAGYPVAILPNVKGTIFSDPAVRQALQIGFDRKQAISGVIGDWFHASTSALSSTTVGYKDLSTDLAADPARAEQLLDAAGWKKGPDGIRVKDGKKLKFDVTWEIDWNATSSVLAAVKEQLKKIGFELDINLVPSGQSAAIYKSGKFDSRWVNGYTPEPDTLRAVLAVDAGNWSNRASKDELDGLLQKQVQQVDPTQRNATLAQIQQQLVKEGYLIPIYDWAQSFAVSSKVHGAQLLYLSGPGPLYSDIWLSH